MMTTTELLTSRDERERLDAVKAIAEDRAGEGVDVLVHALGDVSWRVRQAAVVGLVQRGGKEAVAQVLRSLRDQHADLNVQSGAIRVLALAGVDTLGTLTGFLADPDAGLRTCAALTLGAQGNTQALPALIHLVEEDRDPNVRFHAIEALGKLRGAAAVDGLVAVAESRDFNLAFPALDALAAIGDGRVAYRLLPLLEDQLLQTSVVDTLGAIGNEDIVPHLTSLLNDPQNDVGAIARALVKVQGRQASGQRGNVFVIRVVQQSITPESVRNLINALEVLGEPDLRAVVKVLSWVEGPLAEKALTRLLGQPVAQDEVIEALVRKGKTVTLLVVELLSGNDLNTRRAAVEVLGRLGDPRAVPALLEAISRDEELIVVVAGALAMIGDLRAYTPLLGLLGHENAVVRRATISALNSLGHTDIAADMEVFLQSPEPRIRESAVRVMSYVGYPGCADLMFDYCHDTQENVRHAVLTNLPCLEDPRVLPALAWAARDEVAAVRMAAVRALGQMEEADVWPLLQEALQDGDPWVRYFAIRSIGRHRCVQALDALTRLAKEDKAMQVRVAAVEVIGQLGLASALPLLDSLAAAEDSNLSRAAVAALGAIHHPKALPPLLAALDSTEPERQVHALHALGESGLAEAIEALRAAAVSPNQEAGQAAIDALVRSGRPEAVDVLIALAALPNRRDACVAALARVGKEQLDRVAEGLRNPNLDVRRTVVEALARMKAPAALGALITALSDPEGAVRFAAVVALAHASTVQKEKVLAGVAGSDPDSAVRRAAEARREGKS